MRGHLKPYKSYVFIDKDPIIDMVRTAVDDSGMKYKKITEDSGVSGTAMYGWFRGKTKRPQYATVMAVLRAVGKDLVMVDKEHVTRGQPARKRLKLVRGGVR
jgi:DNA-binding phage protein